MASLSLSTIRSALSAQVDTVSGFTLSRQPPSGFGRIPQTVHHKRYSISLSTSQASATRQRSQRVEVESRAEIRYAYRLRPKDAYPTDYDASLDTEEAIIGAILSGDYSSSASGLQISLRAAERRADDSGEWLFHTLDFSIFHSIPIT